VSKTSDIEWKARGCHGYDKTKPDTSSIYAYGVLTRAFKNGKLRFKRGNQSQGKVNIDFSPADFLPNTTLKAEVLVDSNAPSFAEAAKPTVSAEYNAPEFKGKLSFASGVLAKAQATFGKPEVGAGVDVAFHSGEGRFHAYNAAFWFAFENSMLCFKHVSKNKTAYELGDFVHTYYRKISDKTSVGGRLTTNLASKSSAFEFGGEHKPTDEITLKGKVASDGKMGLSYSNQVNSGTKITVATLLDTLKITRTGITDYSMGFRIEFTG
jgi:hypothetical protein